jgi:hypothetical protein
MLADCGLIALPGFFVTEVRQASSGSPTFRPDKSGCSEGRECSEGSRVLKGEPGARRGAERTFCCGRTS